MRKPPTYKENRTFEEIVEDGAAAFLLYTDKERSVNVTTASDRLKLLSAYAEIANSAGSEITQSEFEKANFWYSSNGYPSILGKEHSRGEVTRPIEVVYPILLSAKSIRGLLNIYDLWRNQLTLALHSLMREEKEVPATVVEKIHLASDPSEQLVAENRRRNVIVNELLRQKLSDKKYRRTIPDTNIREFPTQVILGKTKIAGRRMRFQGADLAWYSDYAGFSPISLEPFLLEQETDEQILACAEDQLLKAANIMLKGIQPYVTSQKGKGLVYEYVLKDDWHIIAKAFAELITDQSLSLTPKECEVCKRDISALIQSAKKCSECSKKKRKPKR